MLCCCIWANLSCLPQIVEVCGRLLWFFSVDADAEQLELSLRESHISGKGQKRKRSADEDGMAKRSKHAEKGKRVLESVEGDEDDSDEEEQALRELMEEEGMAMEVDEQTAESSESDEEAEDSSSDVCCGDVFFSNVCCSNACVGDVCCSDFCCNNVCCWSWTASNRKCSVYDCNVFFHKRFRLCLSRI